MQNTKEKYTRYVISFIFIFLGFIGMSVYPTSHSKFIDTNDNALTYKTQLYKLYQGVIDLEIDSLSSTYKKLQLDFNLPRNTIAKSGETDVYTIEIPKNCEMVTHGLIILESSSTANRYQTSFVGNETSKKITFACNIPVNTSGVQPVSVLVQVYEKINNEQSFLYKDNIDPNSADQLPFHMDNYYDLKSLPSLDFTLKEFNMPLYAKNKYENFEIWISNYLNTVLTKSSDKKMVKDYIKTVYNSDATLLNENLSLMGITMTPDKERGVYTFRIEDNLVGYARTWKTPFPNSMYFSTTSKPELDKAFKYYLGRYLTDLDDYQTVLDYLDHFSNGQGISYLLFENEDGTYNTISGFDPYYDDANQLVLDEALLEYAYSYKLNKIRVDYHEYEEDRQVSFKVSLRNVYGKLISSDIYSELTSNSSEVMNAAIQVDQDQFHDYFMIYDEVKKQYLYIEVYSLAEESYNYVEVHIIPETDNIVLSIVNQENQIKILVNNTTVADLNSFVEQLVLDETIKVIGPEDVEPSIFINGATAEELIDIITQLNTYLETLKNNDAIISKEEDEKLILDSEEEIGIKE